MSSRLDIPNLDRNKFKNIYLDLMYYVDVLDRIDSIDNLKSSFRNVFRRLIDYFNEGYHVNVGISFTDFPKVDGESALARFNLYNLLIEFDVSCILDKMVECKNKGDGYYNPITFSIYLLNVVFHEFAHYLQYYENSILTEDNYYTALSLLNENYYERQIEGDAYGAGVNMMYYFINHDYIPSSYVNCFNRDMMKKSFISDVVSSYMLTHWLSIFPFVSTKDGFESLTSYVNDKLIHFKRKELYDYAKKYPSILLGLSKVGREKDADELVDQFINKRIVFEGRVLGNLSENGLGSLSNIYLYLLLPKLNSSNYMELCNKYGYNKMRQLLISIKESILQKRLKYDEAFKESIYWFKIVDHEKLSKMKVDYTYIVDKYNIGIKYLEDSLNIIDNFLNYGYGSRRVG